MSTRCVLAVRTESGVVGRYCHFDGYPEAKVPSLVEVIQRDGAAKAAETILKQDQGGWSVFDPDSASESNNSLGSRAEVIAGYGIAYRDAPKGEGLLKWDECVSDCFIEYGYIIDPEKSGLDALEAYELHSSTEVRLDLQEYLES